MKILKCPCFCGKRSINARFAADIDSGTSNDWFADQGARFSFTFELRDDGYGRELPPEFIIPSGEEVWAAFRVFFDKLLEE